MSIVAFISPAQHVNDGLIYYTEDHYASFELLYGEE